MQILSLSLAQRVLFGAILLTASTGAGCAMTGVSPANLPAREPNTPFRWVSPLAPTQVPPTSGIHVRGTSAGGWDVVLPPGGGSIAVVDSQMRPEMLGADNIFIEINPAVGHTQYAGLIFTTPCVVEILMDGTVLINRAGVEVKDRRGYRWRSRQAFIGGRQVSAFFPPEEGSAQPL